MEYTFDLFWINIKYVSFTKQTHVSVLLAISLNIHFWTGKSFLCTFQPSENRKMPSHSHEIWKTSSRRCTWESTRSATFWGNETEQRTASWRLWKAILQMSAFPLHPVLLCFHTSICIWRPTNIAMLHNVESRAFLKTYRFHNFIVLYVAVYVYPKSACWNLCTDAGHHNVALCDNEM